jgi:DNA-binding LacI/PurR family transcriptional regulator
MRTAVFDSAGDNCVDDVAAPRLHRSAPADPGEWPTRRPPRVSIVVPVRNEAANLPHVFARLPHGVHEVIVVDGHSEDDTVAVARMLRPDVRILRQPRRGKGDALACGFQVARGEIVVMIDGDGSNDPGEIPRFIAALTAGADFAKGSRFTAGGGSSDITVVRRAGNRVLSALMNVLFATGYSDLCYGYNAFWRDCLPDLASACDGFEVEAVLNARAARNGLVVVEVPSIEHSRLHGDSNLRPVRDGARVLRALVVERFRRPVTADRGTIRRRRTSGERKPADTPLRSAPRGGTSYRPRSGTSARPRSRSAPRHGRNQRPGPIATSAAARSRPAPRPDRGQRPRTVATSAPARSRPAPPNDRDQRPGRRPPRRSRTLTPLDGPASLQPVAMATSDASVHTIADIARLAGVSKSTVSRALNDSPLVAVATRERIQEIAREHRFEMNDPARRLSLRQSNVAALVTYPYQADASQPDAFLLEIMSGISAGLHAHGYDLLVIQVSPRDSDWVRRYLESGRVDGFVVLAASCTRQHLRALAERGAPFVIWGIPPGSHGQCTVSGDSFTGGRLATEHLLSRGCGRIGFVGGPANEAEVQDRYRGYEAALRDAGRAIDPALVAHGDYSPGSGTASMRALLEAADDLDGVFVNSDLMAIAAMTELRAHGRRVPADVAVVGYDDITIARHSDPPLTTIRQDLPLAGRLLAQTLIQHLRTGAVTNVSIPAELVVRESA